MRTSRIAHLPSPSNAISIRNDVPISGYTRFGIGGPADILIDASSEDEFRTTIADTRRSGRPFLVIGGGTNLIVSDDGYRGVVIRYTADGISCEGNVVTAEAGAVLQDLVDFSLAHDLAGIHTMTGIPGWVGGAVYGNA